MKRKNILLLVIPITIVVVCLFLLYYSKDSGKDAAPITHQYNKYNGYLKKIQEIKSAHYIVNYSDGRVFEEMFTPDIIRSIDEDGEYYDDHKWRIDLKKDKKVYLARYIENISDEIKNHVPFITRLARTSEGNMDNDSIVRLPGNKIVTLNSDGYPVQCTGPDETFTIKYISINQPLEIAIPEAPVDYFSRLLLPDDYIWTDGEESEFSNTPELFDEKYNLLNDIDILNFTGIIKGETVSIYLHFYKHTGKLKAHIYGNKLNLLRPDRVKYLSGYNVEMRTYQGELAFKGEVTPTRLEGEWYDDRAKAHKIKLHRPPYHADFEVYMSEDSTKIFTMSLDDYRNELINYRLIHGQIDLLNHTGYDCDYGNGFDIDCNENGILSVSLHSSNYCEGDIRGSIWERFLVFDLLTGRQIYDRDMLVENYKDILVQLGHGYIQEMDIIISPNGITFTGHFSNWGPGEQKFLTWEQARPIIKPYGPLSPFLVQYKVVPEQIQVDSYTQTQASYKHEYMSIGNYFNGLARVGYGSKYGFIDKKGNEIIPLEYESVTDFIDSVSIVCQDVSGAGKRYFVMDMTGKKSDSHFSEIGYFHEGIAMVKDNDKYNYIDKKGRIINSTPFDQAYDFKDGMAIVSVNKKTGVINRQGEYIIQPEYERIFDFRDGIATIIKNNKYGFINKTGTIIVPPEYNYVYPFSEGIGIVSQDGKRYVTTDGTILPGVYEDAEEFTNGFARIRKNGKRGLINKEGREIVEPIYDYVYNFENGHARVEKDKKMGVVNEAGELIVELKYSYINNENGITHAKTMDGKYVFLDRKGKEYKTRKELVKAEGW